MQYNITKKFDSNKHSQAIKDIINETNGTKQEPYYMKIARDILSKEGFGKITKRSELKGVPFDFIAND